MRIKIDKEKTEREWDCKKKIQLQKLPKK
jgi:hypothetical protein